MEKIKNIISAIGFALLATTIVVVVMAVVIAPAYFIGEYFNSKIVFAIVILLDFFLLVFIGLALED